MIHNFVFNSHFAMLWTDDRDWVVVQGTPKLRGQRRFLGLDISRSILSRQTTGTDSLVFGGGVKIVAI